MNVRCKSKQIFSMKAHGLTTNQQQLPDFLAALCLSNKAFAITHKHKDDFCIPLWSNETASIVVAVFCSAHHTERIWVSVYHFHVPFFSNGKTQISEWNLNPALTEFKVQRRQKISLKVTLALCGIAEGTPRRAWLWWGVRKCY